MNKEQNSRKAFQDLYIYAGYIKNMFHVPGCVILYGVMINSWRQIEPPRMEKAQTIIKQDPVFKMDCENLERNQGAIIMTLGQQKLKNIMQADGYKMVSKKAGISYSQLNSLLNGNRDPKQMKLSTALKLMKTYGIQPLEWLEE